MAEDNQTFGEQAARFSLYAPFVALGIGILLIRDSATGGLKFSLAVLNCILIGAGLVFGVVALALIRRHNRRRILGRALVGVLLNAFLAVSATTFFLTARHRVSLGDQVVGHWQTTTKTPAMIVTGDFFYKPDGTFDMKTTRSDGLTVNVHGRWGLSKSNQLVLSPTQSDGDQAILKQQLVLGKVMQADDQQLILDTGSGQEISHRIR